MIESMVKERNRMFQEVSALTDESGAVYQSYCYDAWGNPTAFNSSKTVIANSEISSPWLFTGRYFDEMTGLYNYRARAYSPVLGRFMQTDPLDLGGGDPNIFRYCQNDPINLVDPSGLLGINDCPDFSLGGQDLQNSLTNQLNSLSSGNSNGNSSSSGTAGTGGKGGNSNGGPGGSAGNASGQGESGFNNLLQAMSNAWNNHGSIDFSVSGGDVLGGGATLSLSQSGFSFTPMVGFGMGAGASVTANMNAGNQSGLGVGVQASGGNFLGAQAGGGLSLGGFYGSTGVGFAGGAGVAAGAGWTISHTYGGGWSFMPK